MRGTYTQRHSKVFLFFFKQKTAYEITYGDWSSDVCSSDLECRGEIACDRRAQEMERRVDQRLEIRRGKEREPLLWRKAAMRGRGQLPLAPCRYARCAYRTLTSGSGLAAARARHVSSPRYSKDSSTLVASA